MRAAQDAGIEVQINSTITRLNVAHLPRLLALAEELGAVSFHPSCWCPTGRGKDLAADELDPDDYERTLNWIYDAQRSSPLFFKPTDAALLAGHAPAGQGRRQHAHVHPHAHGGLDRSAAAAWPAWASASSRHVGVVQPCGYFDKAAGNVREQELQARSGATSPLFTDLRRPRRGSRAMRRLRVQAGLRRLRARAFERTGDYLAEEPTAPTCRAAGRPAA